MKITKKRLDGMYEITAPENFVDKRGFMLRIFDDRFFKEKGIDVLWKQQSLSYTATKNVVRGLNIQLAPFTEGKLITVLTGEMFWVSVDMHKKSPTFGKWDSAVLSREGVNALFVKPGFAHGCLSLTDDCYVLLNSDNYHSGEHSKGIAWDDKDLGIDWPLNGSIPMISDMHRAYPSFNTFVAQFGGV
ncbi:MAG: dTDP-4-dehydrorhamnose 3,5-epimerase family protein [Candidatus Omnitrophica bacterium]|nr:dTDP-4-dehydrorhamnose 3,5-epimerase family protein [Candidatus Omnitrophota bacterium]